MRTDDKRPLQLLEEFMDADIDLEYGIGDKLFVRFVRLLVVLAHFAVVLGILAVGGLGVWLYGGGVIFLYRHWQWALAGLGLLIVFAFLGRRASKARAATHN
jgi:hypothetical protein